MTYGILQARSGTATEWASLNPILEAGEIGHVAPDTPGGDYSLKIGDGISPWNELPTISGGGGGGGGVESVNGKAGVVTLTASDVGAKAASWEPDLSGLVPHSIVGAPGGVASLDGGGRVPSAQLPALDDGDVASLIASQGSQVRAALDGLYAPAEGSVRFVSGSSSVARGTASTDVCVIFLVGGDVAPVNAISGVDVWLRTL